MILMIVALTTILTVSTGISHYLAILLVRKIIVPGSIFGVGICHICSYFLNAYEVMKFTQTDRGKSNEVPIMTNSTARYFLSLLCWTCLVFLASTVLSLSVLADNRSNIRVVTEIEDELIFSGIKSEHSYHWKLHKHSVVTGTTDISFPGGFTYKIQSVRNNFRSWRNKEGVFMKGSTKSGMTFGVGPGIDYSFRFTGRPNNTRISGCHDGYPSYKIYINGKLVYYFKHKSIRVLKLFGKCDVKVDSRVSFPK